MKETFTVTFTAEQVSFLASILKAAMEAVKEAPYKEAAKVMPYFEGVTNALDKAVNR